MSKATYPLKLPLSIKKAAQRLAKEDGVSLNQWIAVAVAEKVEAVETAAEFFKKRAGKATGEGLMKLLRTAPEPPALQVSNRFSEQLNFAETGIDVDNYLGFSLCVLHYVASAPKALGWFAVPHGNE